MVWGCFSAQGVGKLHKINGNMNSTQYKNILRTKMLTSATKLFNGENFIFQHDTNLKPNIKKKKRTKIK